MPLYCGDFSVACVLDFTFPFGDVYLGLKDQLGTSLLALAFLCQRELWTKHEVCVSWGGWALTMLVCALQSSEKGSDYVSSQKC